MCRPSSASIAPEGAGRLAARPDVLFAYGTLRFPRVIHGILGRVPSSEPDKAQGWRAAALSGRVYPGLVPSAACDAAPGLLYTDLTAGEWSILDRFEDRRYSLRRVQLASGRYGWTYVWDEQDVLPESWSAEAFEVRDLDAYVSRFSVT